MRSCKSPAGRLESHQRGFGIETLFQMQKTKAPNWLFPENIRRVEKQADSYFWGVDAQEIPGGKPEVWLALPSELLPHYLVMSGIPHAGSRHYWERMLKCLTLIVDLSLFPSSSVGFPFCSLKLFSSVHTHLGMLLLVGEFTTSSLHDIHLWPC